MEIIDFKTLELNLQWVCNMWMEGNFIKEHFGILLVAGTMKKEAIMNGELARFEILVFLTLLYSSEIF